MNLLSLTPQLKKTELSHGSYECALHYSTVQGDVSEDHFISLGISTGSQGLVDR